MDRKPKAFRLAEKLQKHESTEMEPESNNPSLEKVDVQLESKSPTMEKVEPQQASSSRTSLREKEKKIPAKVRRSGRLQSAVMASENRDAETQDIERILEEITIVESEKEDEPADEKMPDPTLNRKILDEKLDYVVELLEAQQKTMDSLNYGAIGKTFFNEGSGMGDITYKSLYLDSQKKVQALTEENRQLNRKLEYALGKIEVYENRNHVAPEVLEKLKDLFKDALWLSGLTRVTEATRNSTGPENGHDCNTSAKRKRLNKDKN